MQPFHVDPDCTYYVCDVREVAASLPEKSVHVVVTSPPYFGLRDYGIAPSVWGGSTDCAHDWGDVLIGATTTDYVDVSAGRIDHAGSSLTISPRVTVRPEQGCLCRSCGAWRGCLGREPLHDCLGWARQETCALCFICHLRVVAAAIWRVLRDDGTLWINIGDSYAGSRKVPTGNNGIGDQERRQGFVGGHHPQIDDYYAKRSKNVGGKRTPIGLKPKDKFGIPERMALALQSDGWYWRDTVHLLKTTPMPESVRDRFTQAHEPLFVFSKSKRYLWDQDAIREPSTSTRPSGNGFHRPEQVSKGGEGQSEHWQPVALRNPRNWAMWNPEPSAGEHFATFPRFIPALAIRAGSSEYGVCPTCGAPWDREVSRSSAPAVDTESGKWLKADPNAAARRMNANKNGRRLANGNPSDDNPFATPTTLGWRPTCSCGADVVPATVWDPFSGSGTTQRAARELGRRSIYTDLSATYADMAIERLEGVTPMLPNVGAATANGMAEVAT